MDALCYSGVCDRIIVSTDSQKIAQCVLKYGSGVGVLYRPTQLATGTSKVMDAIQYHLTWDIADTYDYVIMHHATAPLADSVDIKEALSTLIENKADFIISMCKSPLSLGVVKPVPENKSVRGWFPKELRGLNRQEIPTRYELDNNIYIGKWDIFKNNMDYWETNIIMYEMPVYKRADIDTEEDFKRAEKQYGNLHNRRNRFFRKIFSV